MALICPACGTENRSVAKFCIECIGALPTDFAPTRMAPPRTTPGDGTTLDGMPSVLAAFAASPPPQPVAIVRAAAPPPSEPKGRKGLWVSVGALAIALLVGAAGWAAAGAGGWYIYRANAETGEREPAGTPAVATGAEPAHAAAPASAPSAASTPAPAPASVSVSASAPTVASSLAPGEALVAAATEPLPEAAAQAEQHPGTPVATAARAAPRPRAAAASVPAASTLDKACGGMNFIAASRCKVAQCSKPAWHQAAECRSVLAQQRLMEEKRNPTLAN